jgi:pyridoxamine 5'-phosphate oxidase
MTLDDAVEPFDLFRGWFAEAEAAEPLSPEAVALATADADGRPAVRMVLLKGADEAGFVFYTNLESRKGGDLAANPRAALCLYWKSLGRQVRVEGGVVPVTPEEADAYFASRARDSRLGAWASRQSRALESRAVLEARVAAVAAEFPGDTVPRPPHWSGFRVVPQRIEFWQEQPYRLHDRIVFERDSAGWNRTRLFP